MNIRRATEADVPAIAAIYDAIHTREEAGLTTIGWKRGVYPTAETAMDSVQKGTMYVIEDDNGHVLSAAKIDQNQGEEYARAQWKHATPPERVLVMHTLVVDPAHEGHGLGHNFIHFYEERARSLGCLALRMDTNMRNVARAGDVRQNGLRGSRRGGLQFQRHPRRDADVPGKIPRMSAPQPLVAVFPRPVG